MTDHLRETLTLQWKTACEGYKYNNTHQFQMGVYDLPHDPGFYRLQVRYLHIFPNKKDATGFDTYTIPYDMYLELFNYFQDNCLEGCEPHEPRPDPWK